MKRLACLLGVWLLAVVVAEPGCNLFSDLGNSWCDTAAGGDEGAGAGDEGAGGDDGAGGDPSWGGVGGGSGDVGATSADVGATSGDGATSADVGAGAGDPGERTVPIRHRHVRRHHREHIGIAVSADCSDPATPVNVPPPPPPPAPPPPTWKGLDTGMLRQIAITNNINGCATQSGVAQNRTIGLAFEAWVLKTKWPGKERWRTLIPSSARKKANNGGLPASVIPEFVDDQVKFKLSAPFNLTWDYFPNSLFYEVKAVNGTLTPGASNWQILGLLDGLTSFPTVPSGPHSPPAVIFTTTSNTIVSTTGTPSVPGVVAQANAWGVGVWQEKVYYDSTSATPDNPLLHLGPADCLNPSVYMTLSLYWLDPKVLPWKDNPLTWTTVQEQNDADVPGDPDSPAVVP